MNRKITLEKDYYDEGYSLYKKKTITIKPGVTVLVGCNGIGKTTLLRQIQDNLKADSVPYISFDNLKDGGGNAISEASFNGNFGFMATAMCSSEGENILMNMFNFASRLRHFIKTGEDPKERLRFKLAETIKKINGEQSEAVEIPKERWLLFDAVDSGLSVDNIVDIKEQLFKTILKDAQDNEMETYIVISANEYEMARGEQCFDVFNGKYITFKDYEEYRNLVLQSKEWKYQRSETEMKD